MEFGPWKSAVSSRILCGLRDKFPPDFDPVKLRATSSYLSDRFRHACSEVHRLKVLTQLLVGQWIEAIMVELEYATRDEFDVENPPASDAQSTATSDNDDSDE